MDYFGVIFLLIFGLIYPSQNFIAQNKMNSTEIGKPIDSLNGILVYENGNIKNISGRNTTSDGYNLGLKYQCVEFVKRYYYEFYNHKMPNSWGDAKDYFNSTIKDGEKNEDRDLIQYSNPSDVQPRIGDLLVYKPTEENTFGHVAIISKVEENHIKIIQQNPDAGNKSREIYELKYLNQKWKIQNNRILGWLRKE